MLKSLLANPLSSSPKDNNWINNARPVGQEFVHNFAPVYSIDKSY